MSGGIGKTDVASISNTLINLTTDIQTATYQVTPKIENCVGDPFIVIVTVNPKPIVNTAILEICSGETFNHIPSNVNGQVVPNGIKYTWNVTNHNSVSGESSVLTSTATLSQTLANTSNV